MKELQDRARIAQAVSQAEQHKAAEERKAKLAADTAEAIDRMLREYLDVTKYQEVQTFDLPAMVMVNGLHFTAVRNELYHLWSKRPWSLHLARKCARCGADTVVGPEIESLVCLAEAMDWVSHHETLCPVCTEQQKEREARTKLEPRLCPVLMIGNHLGQQTDICRRERCAWWAVDSYFGNGCALRSLAMYAQATASMLANRQVEDSQKEVEPNRGNG